MLRVSKQIAPQIMMYGGQIQLGTRCDYWVLSNKSRADSNTTSTKISLGNAVLCKSKLKAG